MLVVFVQLYPWNDVLGVAGANRYCTKAVPFEAKTPQFALWLKAIVSVQVLPGLAWKYPRTASDAFRWKITLMAPPARVFAALVPWLAKLQPDPVGTLNGYTGP